MPWFYVDDGFSDSKPVLNMPDRYRLAACGLWTLAGSWSAKEELDGFVPDSKLRQLGARPPILAALTEPGPMSAPLCSRVEGGIQFNSWGKWQKTRDELMAKRREDADRQRAWREAHPEAKTERKTKGRNSLHSANTNVSHSDNDVTDHVTDSVTNAVTNNGVTTEPSRARTRGPDPTRPDPQKNSGYLPESASLSNARDAIAATPGADLVRELIPDTIPASERTRLRIGASALLHAGTAREDIAEGLRLYLAKPHLGAGALDTLVSEAIRARAAPTANGRQHKLRSGAQLAAEVRAQEQAELETANRRALE